MKFLAALILLLALSCTNEHKRSLALAQLNLPPNEKKMMRVIEDPNYMKGSHRLVLLGDVHGDMENLLEILREAQVIDCNNKWISSGDTVVQLGDITDRGPHSHTVLEFFEELKKDAAEHGGEFIELFGNHEWLNLKGDNRFTNKVQMERAYGSKEEYKKAWSLEGKYGALVANLPTVVIRNGTVLVHGGITPKVAKEFDGDIEAINDKVRSLLHAKNFQHPLLVDGGPFWARDLVKTAQKGDCSLVYESLKLISEHEMKQGRPKVTRMIVGHTIQPMGLVQVLCNEHFLAMDIAMSQYMPNGGWLGFVEIRARGGAVPKPRKLYDNSFTKPANGGTIEDLQQNEQWLTETAEENPQNVGPMVRYPPDRDRKHVFHPFKKPAWGGPNAQSEVSALEDLVKKKEASEGGLIGGGAAAGFDNFIHDERKALIQELKQLKSGKGHLTAIDVVLLLLVSACALSWVGFWFLRRRDASSESLKNTRSSSSAGLSSASNGSDGVPVGGVGIDIRRRKGGAQD